MLNFFNKKQKIPSEKPIYNNLTSIQDNLSRHKQLEHLFKGKDKNTIMPLQGTSPSGDAALPLLDLELYHNVNNAAEEAIKRDEALRIAQANAIRYTENCARALWNLIVLTKGAYDPQTELFSVPPKKAKDYLDYFSETLWSPHIINQQTRFLANELVALLTPFLNMSTEQLKAHIPTSYAAGAAIFKLFMQTDLLKDAIETLKSIKETAEGSIEEFDNKVAAIKAGEKRNAAIKNALTFMEERKTYIERALKTLENNIEHPIENQLQNRQAVEKNINLVNTLKTELDSYCGEQNNILFTLIEEGYSEEGVMQCAAKKPLNIPTGISEEDLQQQVLAKGKELFSPLNIKVERCQTRLDSSLVACSIISDLLDRTVATHQATSIQPTHKEEPMISAESTKESLLAAQTENNSDSLSKSEVAHLIKACTLKWFEAHGIGANQNSLNENYSEIISYCIENDIALYNISSLKFIEAQGLLLKLVEIFKDSASKALALSVWKSSFEAALLQSDNSLQKEYKHRFISTLDQKLKTGEVKNNSLLTIIDMRVLFGSEKFHSEAVLISPIVTLEGIKDSVDKKILELLKVGGDKTLFIPVICDGHWFYLLREKERWTLQDSQSRLGNKDLTPRQQKIRDESRKYLQKNLKITNAQLAFSTTDRQTNNYECGTHVINAYRTKVCSGYSERSHEDLLNEAVITEELRQTRQGPAKKQAEEKQQVPETESKQFSKKSEAERKTKTPSSLFSAAKHGYFEIFKQEVSEHFDLNDIQDTWSKQNVLHYACMTTGSQDNDKNAGVISGKLNCVEFILANKKATLDINQQSSLYRYTPLMVAAKAGFLAIVNRLIESGATVSLRGAGNIGTAVELAYQNQHLLVTNTLQAKERMFWPKQQQDNFSELYQQIKALHLESIFLDNSDALISVAIHKYCELHLTDRSIKELLATLVDASLHFNQHQFSIADIEKQEISSDFLEAYAHGIKQKKEPDFAKMYAYAINNINLPERIYAPDKRYADTGGFIKAPHKSLQAEYFATAYKEAIEEQKSAQEALDYANDILRLCLEAHCNAYDKPDTVAARAINIRLLKEFREEGARLYELKGSLLMQFITESYRFFHDSDALQKGHHTHEAAIASVLLQIVKKKASSKSLLRDSNAVTSAFKYFQDIDIKNDEDCNNLHAFYSSFELQKYLLETPEAGERFLNMALPLWLHDNTRESVKNAFCDLWLLVYRQYEPKNIRVNKIINPILRSALIKSRCITQKNSQQSLTERFVATESMNHQFINAARKGDVPTVRKLFDVCNQAKDELGMSALSWAVYNNHISTAKILLELGMSPESMSKENKKRNKHHPASALHLAVQYDHIDMVQLLLKNQATVDYKDNDGQTALMAAASKGQVAIVQLLLDGGSNINEAILERQYNKGMTPLMLAAQSGNLETVRLLLENNADINAKDVFGRTATMIAAREGHGEALKLLIRKDENKTLDARDRSGKTVIWYANSRDITDCLPLLRDKEFSKKGFLATITKTEVETILENYERRKGYGRRLSRWIPGKSAHHPAVRELMKLVKRSPDSSNNNIDSFSIIKCFLDNPVSKDSQSMAAYDSLLRIMVKTEKHFTELKELLGSLSDITRKEFSEFLNRYSAENGSSSLIAELLQKANNSTPVHKPEQKGGKKPVNHLSAVPSIPKRRAKVTKAITEAEIADDLARRQAKITEAASIPERQATALLGR